MSDSLITIEDFKPLLDEIANYCFDEININEQSPIKQIKNLCLAFKILSGKKETREQAYRLGFKLVFLIRSYLTQEKLLFAIGATSPDGTKTSVTKVEQDELINNTLFKVNLKNKQIELSSQLEKYNSDNTMSESLENLWQGVKDKSSFEWEKGVQYHKKIYITSRKKRRIIYQKNSSDTNVWMRWYQQQKTRVQALYYKKSETYYMAYNQGWLYEWFLNYTKIQENQEKLAKALNTSSVPLKELMQGSSRENVEGYKGGDYVDLEKRQVQAKFGNIRLITFKSIEKVILGDQGILQSIIQYEKALKNQENKKQEFAESLMKIFTSTAIYTDEQCKNIVNNILRNLTL